MIKICSRSVLTLFIANFSVSLFPSVLLNLVAVPALGKPSAESVAAYKEGMALMHETKCREAIEPFSRAIKLDPTASLCYCQRAHALQQCDNFDAALTDLDRAIAIDPGLAEAHFIKSQIYASRTQNKLAMSECDKAVALSHGRASWIWWSECGALHELNGDLEKALLDYGESIRLEPNGDAAYHRRANIYYKMGRYQDAINDATNGMKAHCSADTHYRMYDIRAKCYDKIGRHDLAIKDRKVLEKEVGADWGKP